MVRRQDRGWGSLPTFSREMYEERYFLKGEDYTQWIERMSKYSDDNAMAERIKTYIHNCYFHPSTPISSNGNAPQRGLPISCYVNEVTDSKEGIFEKFTENNWLGAQGGGIGTSWSKVRGIGEQVGVNGQSSGIIPFIKVSDSSTLAVSQGGLRRASQAVYLNDTHPELEEFIDVRRPTGDANRRSLNVHHGVVLSDDFMVAVEARQTWDLISPKTEELFCTGCKSPIEMSPIEEISKVYDRKVYGLTDIVGFKEVACPCGCKDTSKRKKVVKTVDAFDIWKKILINRMETGEPFIMFKDTVNRLAPYEYKLLNKEITMSNLCAEIALHTAPDYTGVCCLASLNLEYWDEYKDDLEQIVYDCTRFLDNVLQDFIDLTENMEGFKSARASAINERSLGLGVMGFHSLLQRKGLSWDSPMTKGLNFKIFQEIDVLVDKANEKAAERYGECLMSNYISSGKRNINVTSIAPTASISTLCGATSQGIDMRLANAYIHKTNIGSYTVKNKYLEEVLEKHNKNTEDVWKSIVKNAGSVQHLDFLSDYDKNVFKTAIEANQFVTIDLAADRAPHITQSQSVNVFLEADEDVRNVYNLHIRAWKLGVKSLYYCRSTAAVRADSTQKKREIIEVDQCLSCQ